MQVRLQGEARAGVERGYLFERERRALAAVEGFNKSPLDAGDVEGQAMTSAGELRIGTEPFSELRAKIAQGKGAAGMSAEIGDREGFKDARSNDWRGGAGKSSASAPSTRYQYWRL